MQQGPFAPQALPRFFAIASPAATVSPSLAFPVWPVIRTTLLRRFPGGARTASPVAQHVLATVLSLLPRRSDLRVCQFAPAMLPSPDIKKARPSDYFLSRPPLGLLSLRPVTQLHGPFGAISALAFSRSSIGATNDGSDRESAFLGLRGSRQVGREAGETFDIETSAPDFSAQLMKHLLC
jgi:hypothetical protein